MKNLFLIPLVIMILASLILGSCASSTPVSTSTSAPQKEYLIRFSTEYPVADSFSKILKEMEKIVPQETNGLVKFEFYPGGILYNRTEALVALQSGSLEMTEGGQGLSSYSKEWDVISGLAFLLDDIPHMQRFFNTDTYKDLVKRMEADGISTLTKPYSQAPSGYHIWNSKRPISNLEEAKGIKIACPPFPTWIKTIEMLGLNALAVPIPELATSFETGVVDGAWGPLQMAVSFDFKKNLPYLTFINTNVAPEGIVVSKKWWDTLPTDLQQKLQSLFEACMQRYEEYNLQDEQKILAEYKATSGTVVSVVKSEEKARWRERVKTLWDELAAADPNIRAIIEAANSTR
jgi:TRAP-type C4-dicarboxylate transport system substrate-binding protein